MGGCKGDILREFNPESIHLFLLFRMLEATLMIMESLDGFDSRFQYSIVGHSGDSPDIPFVKFGEPPSNAKDKMNVLQKMIAHSQYCLSGDNTVQGIQVAMRKIVEEVGNLPLCFYVC